MDKTIAIIFGYLKNIDDTAKKAKSNGLEKRFALAFDEWIAVEEKGENRLDKIVAIKIIYEIGKTIDSDSIIIYDSHGKHYASYEDYLNNTIEETEPFAEIEYMKNGHMICFIETIPWANVGGPYPYHDTWTFSYYLKGYDKKKIQNMIKNICTEESVSIRKTLTGGEKPSIPLLQRVMDIFRI